MKSQMTSGGAVVFNKFSLTCDRLHSYPSLLRAETLPEVSEQEVSEIEYEKRTGLGLQLAKCEVALIHSVCCAGLFFQTGKLYTFLSSA
jgi:hypothetical protein